MESCKTRSKVSNLENRDDVKTRSLKSEKDKIPKIVVVCLRSDGMYAVSVHFLPILHF